MSKEQAENLTAGPNEVLQKLLRVTCPSCDGAVYLDLPQDVVQAEFSFYCNHCGEFLTRMPRAQVKQERREIANLRSVN